MSDVNKTLQNLKDKLGKGINDLQKKGEELLEKGEEFIENTHNNRIIAQKEKDLDYLYIKLGKAYYENQSLEVLEFIKKEIAEHINNIKPNTIKELESNEIDLNQISSIQENNDK